MKFSISKKVLSVVLAFALVFSLGFAAPVESKAYTYTGSLYGQVMQVDATDSTATITWPGLPDAVGYYVYVGSDSVYPVATLDAATTSYTLTNLAADSYAAVYVYPIGCDASGATAAGSYGGLYVYTTATVTGVGYAYTRGFEKTSGLYVAWNKVANADGYEAVLYNSKGKKVQTVNATTYYCNFSKANRKNTYSVKVRSYINLADGKKAYGAVSSAFYCVPQPITTSKDSDVHTNSVKLKWKKVTGAKSYTIYCSTSSSKIGKKIATVKGTKTSYTATKVGGSKINTTKKTYYFTIVTSAKMGGKVRKSAKSYYLSAYSYYY